MRLYFLLVLSLLSVSASADTTPKYHIQYFTERDGYSQSHVTSVLQDATGMIWVGCWEGLYSYDGYRFKKYKSELIDDKPATESRILRIVELPNHDILCLWPGYAFRFDRKTKTFHNYQVNSEKAEEHYRPGKVLKMKVDSLSEFHNHKLSILYVDKQDGIWIYSEQGFCRLMFDKPKLNRMKLSQTSEEIICAMQPCKNNRLWIGNKNGVVTCSDTPKTYLYYLTPDGKITEQYAVFGQNIYTILEDHRGYIWLGSRQNGIFRLQPTGDKAYAITQMNSNNSALNCNYIYDIAEDGMGRLWVATHGGGINVITNPTADQPTIINGSNGLDYKGADRQEMDARRLLIHNNLLLAGTNGGLMVSPILNDVTKMRFRAYLHQPNDLSSIGDNKVRTIVLPPSSSNDIFMGTYGGGITKASLAGLTTGESRMKTYNATNSIIPGEIVMGLSADDKGHLWGTTVSSLFCFDIQRDSLSIYPINLVDEQLIFTETDPVISSDDHILLGTTQGILSFSPEEQMKNSYVPAIITSAGDSIDISPDDNNLFITMSALDYNGHGRINFAYRIDGIDNEWIFTSNHHIYYASLPPGEYTLHIRSTNSDGIWVDNERLIYINRHAAFNERPIAWMLYGILALVGILAIVQVIIYVRRLNRDMHNIELTYKEKLEYTSACLNDTRQTLERHLLLRKDDPITPQDNSEHDNTSQEQLRDAKFIEEVKQFVNDHFKDSDLSVDDIAAHMTISRCAFYLKMKQLFQVTPNNYLLMRRLEHAKQMLKRSDINISEAAYQSGFSDPQYFSRVFRKVEGITPTTYQEQAKTSIPAE